MASKTDRIDVNRASRDELAEIPGIGPSTADALVRAREQRGGFASVGELEEVSGIGAQILESIRSHVTVSPAERAGKQVAGLQAEIAGKAGEAQSEAARAVGRDGQGAAEAAGAEAKEGADAAAASAKGFLQVVHDANQAWFGLIQEQMWANVQTAQQLASCRTPGEAMEVQARYLRSTLDRLARESTRLTDLAARHGRPRSQ